MKSSLILYARTAQRPFSQDVYLIKFYLKMGLRILRALDQVALSRTLLTVVNSNPLQGLSLPDGSGGVSGEKPSRVNDGEIRLIILWIL